MRFRNWLLTGTSITLLALAPTTAARAQDVTNPDLVAAYQAFQADQSDDNKQKLTDACTTAGFASIDDCLAALQAATPPAPIEEAPPPPPPSEEAPPPAPPSEEAPPPEPSSEEAPPPAPVSEEAPAPAPSSEEAPPPAPSSEEAPPPAPSSEEAPPPAPSSEEATPPAPVSEEVAPPAPSSEEAPAPAPSSEEAPPPAPSSEEAPPPAPSSEEAPAPTPSSEEAPPPAPSSEQPQAPDTLAQLTAAVAAYNQGVADLSGGNASGQGEIDQAKAQIDKICADGGFADTPSCLAQFGLTLNPLPAQPGEPSSEQPVTSEPTAPVSEEPKPSEQPVSEMPTASEEVSPSAVEPLPVDVTVAPAPILDSVKDQDQGGPDVNNPAPTPSEPPAPPPKDDKVAQEDIPPPAPELLTTQTDEGKKTDIANIAPPLPPENKDIKVITPPQADPNVFVFQIGINIFINNPQQDRDRFYDRDQGDQIFYEELSRGRTRETIVRPNGVRVVTIRDKYGDVLQRSKILKDGREIILASYDPRDRDINDWRDPGDDLPPLRLTIPVRDYILDADTADEDDVYNFLDQPPVEKVKRIYTIDEVKRSSRLRDSVRRLEVGGLTFDSGKATISRNQVGALQGTAQAMLKMLDRNPGEVFLIEGHTDAVGSDVANLVLSDQRAATVARILTDFYDIPPENLVTQGYGERYLKVKTEDAEPINRRVVVKRITSLVAYDNAKG